MDQSPILLKEMLKAGLDLLLVSRPHRVETRVKDHQVDVLGHFLEDLFGAFEFQVVPVEEKNGEVHVVEEHLGYVLG